jgi:hypothetical protein
MRMTVLHRHHPRVLHHDNIDRGSCGEWTLRYPLHYGQSHLKLVGGYSPARAAHDGARRLSAGLRAFAASSFSSHISSRCRSRRVSPYLSWACFGLPAEGKVAIIDNHLRWLSAIHFRLLYS